MTKRSRPRAIKTVPEVSPEQQARVEVVASRLYRFATSAFTRGTFVNVVAWVESKKDWSRFNIAFVGNAMKVSAVFGMLGEDGVSHLRADSVSYHLKSALGVKESGFEYEHDISLGDFLDRIGGLTIHGITDPPDPFTESHCVFIADPGYPWAENDKPITYWSAADESWIAPERPSWLIEVELDSSTKQMLSRQHDQIIGVNPCAIFPSDESKTAPGGDVYGRVMHGAYDGVSLMVAHSMSLPEPTAGGRKFHKSVDVAIENIKACGGLLFPSLSVGPIPASNFGPVSLIGRLELVLAGLKPYKVRNRNPVWVYDTDAWTAGTAEVMGVIAAQLFDELHGHDDWTHGRHMWVLGPPGEFHGGPRGDQTPVTSTGQLLKGIKKRMKHWREDMDEAEFLVVNEELSGTDAKYAYCEAKAREVVRLDEFPLLVAPDSYADRVKAFVKGVGYKGDVVLLPDQFDILGAEESGDSFRMYGWAWEVAEAVRQYQYKKLGGSIASIRT